MKQRFSVLALALFSVFGLSLASCQNSGGASTTTPAGGESTQGTTTPAAGTEIKSMTFKKYEGNPAVGEAIDLDDYIQFTDTNDQTVDPSTIEYEVTIPESAKEIATLEGHVLTFKKEGEVTARATYGSMTANFSVAAYSEVKSRYVDYVKNVTKDYLLSPIGTMQYQDGSIYFGALPTGVMHNTNYFAYNFSAEIQGAPDDWEGLFQAGDGTSYQFIAPTLGSEQDEIQFVGGSTGNPINLYYLNMDYPITSSTVTTQESVMPEVWNEAFGVTGDVLFFDATTLDTFLSNSLGLSFNAGYELYGGEIAFVDDANYLINYGTEVTTGSYPIINLLIKETLTGEIYTGGTYALITDPEALGIKGIDTAVQNKFTPEAVKDPGVSTMFSKAVSGKNFTFKVEGSWCDWSTGEPIADEEIATIDGADSLPGNFSTKSLYTEDGILISAGDGDIFTAGSGENTVSFANKGQVLYRPTADGTASESYSNMVTDAQGSITGVSDKFTAETIENTTGDIWADFSDITLDTCAKGFDNVVIYMAQQASAEEGGYWMVQISQNPDAFLGGLFKAIPFIGTGLDQQFSTVLPDGSSMYSITSTTILFDEEVMEVQVSLNWDGVYGYTFDFRISDIGETVLPSIE